MLNLSHDLFIKMGSACGCEDEELEHRTDIYEKPKVWNSPSAKDFRRFSHCKPLLFRKKRSRSWKRNLRIKRESSFLRMGLTTRVRWTIRAERMEEGSKSGRTGQLTSVNGAKTRCTGSESTGMRMGIIMRGTLSTTRQRGKESLHTPMALSTMATGKRIFSTVRERRSSPMGASMLGNSRMERKREQAFLNGLMDLALKVSGVGIK